jgi:hypothetical protein
LSAVLARADLTGTTDRIASDLMGVTRGLTGMAGRSRDLDLSDLERRANQAVFGYLQICCCSRPSPTA